MYNRAMATIFYFHGFASVGEGPKTESLRANFPDHVVIAPNIPLNPAKAVEVLSAAVRAATSFPIIFIGTSLGGFWANAMAQKFDAPAILINPSINPSTTMAARVGAALLNYKTGEKIEVTAEDVRQFKELEHEVGELYNGALIHLFLAQDDEVLPYEVTLSQLPYTATLNVAVAGGHRYLLGWNNIIDCVKILTI